MKDIILGVLELLCGLALFLYGMDVMGDGLKKSAGSKLKTILGKMTSSPVKGFLLGLGVTAVIQSSSATTVMVVGFVNAGTMTLLQSVGVIMGANLGTAVTAWLTALSSLGGEKGDEAVDLGWLDWLTPDAWMPVLAIIGIGLLMFAKRNKKKDIGTILLGFAVLMVGMDLMSAAVSPLKESESFGAIFTLFENPILGLLVGLVLTMIVQSSSASVGILQALAITGKISFGAAIPIIMGQNIGTCITAILSSISANRNGKRAAMIHLLFNIIGVAFWLPVFYLVNWLIPFIDTALPANAWHIAIIHTIFKIVSVIAIGPFYKYLEKLACLIIKDKKDESEVSNKLDERLFETPSFAVEQATKVTYDMAEVSVSAFKKSLVLLDSYNINLADEVRELESKADKFEDALGSYLVKLSSCDLSEQDSMQITKLLHIIGDLERISDHAVNVVESAEEMNDKKLSFSQEATREMSVFKRTVSDILDVTYESLSKNDIKLAIEVEPIEEVVDDLRDKIKLNHIIRLQKSECTIEHGFILSDLLNNLERVSDHCSNIAGCVIEIATLGDLDMHKHNEKTVESLEFKQRVAYYREKYSL